MPHSTPQQAGVDGAPHSSATSAAAAAATDKGRLAVVTDNGQLVTPALSPILEHDKADREVDRSSESRMMKLSPQQLHALTSSPDSLPLRQLDDARLLADQKGDLDEWHDDSDHEQLPRKTSTRGHHLTSLVDAVPSVATTPAAAAAPRPANPARSVSSPTVQRKQTTSKSVKSKSQLPPLKTDESGARAPSHIRDASPMPATLPLPPPSLPTYLHLELSSDRPSPLYIYRSTASDFPYESSQVKFERLLNFVTLPKDLEQVLLFGAIACLDAWMYTFTIQPLRFLRATLILLRWIGGNAFHELRDSATTVYRGSGRVWQRWRHVPTPVSSSVPPSVTHSKPSSRRTSASESEQSKANINTVSKDSTKPDSPVAFSSPVKWSRKQSAGFRHRRMRSTPSALLPNHKADLLQGLLIICSCTILMWFDASRMYHAIRGQAAIKLYVIYNLLEVFDRLFSALGQDVLECLCSKETLERDSHGRSKILRPLGMFVLALVYNVMHATALFYQAITLNVAVNSYSNALLTLLMSNQFVEIKGTVFKKFEKENLFQLTCADIVERFQLWLMLSIIALRNIVEVGGLSISLSSALGGDSTPTDSWSANGTGLPLVSGYVIPKAFTLFPKWTGEVLGPFIIVLGSEALVDWCKHAYINKFNNIKPNIYGRFLDVLAKDYYSHAFADQNLTKRLGLPVIPLSCLFIRSCMQTYHMFLATHMPLPIPSSSTSISLDSETKASSPATIAALRRIDQVFRRALGRSTFGAGTDPETSVWWSLDDSIAFGTMITVFLAFFLVLLALKLLLGMILLSYARNRYRGMKERERQSVDTHGRRVGGWGAVEVSEDKRRWIYEDDPDALIALQEKERRGRQKAEKGELKLDHVERYTMTAKRIW